ncbi:hypothetical protein GGR56DRAFT_12795 [Xylariaceae sp. FL0804]|nr:hypothetical protein GGR56DRAFT_12795 [Xylariaceae sp. FL0804]
MEEAAKSIESLAKHILPPFRAPHYLSLSPTCKFPPHPDRPRLEEDDIRPLQYTTLVTGDADRGILYTIPYFEVREGSMSTTPAPTPATLRANPKRPKKVSLKDYKNRKVEGESPPKSDTPSSLGAIKERDGPRKLPEPASKEIDCHRDVKRSIPSSRIENSRPDARRQRSPSPGSRKRVADVDESAKKRTKLGDAPQSGASSRPIKDATPQKTARPLPPTKADPKESHPTSLTNGKPGTLKAGARGTPPKPNLQVNGVQKQPPKAPVERKKADTGSSGSAPITKSVPALLSPTLAGNVADLVKEDSKAARPSPKKSAEANSLKPQPKKIRDRDEPSPSSGKRKLLPLLSPTLPAVVMEELARVDKRGSSKEPAQRNSQVPDSPVSAKKTVRTSKPEPSIHAESKKEYLVVLKYKKRIAKTVERLLNLTPKSRAGPAGRERLDPAEPGIARKRPLTTTDVREAAKRPKTSESLHPSTPLRQSTAMTRATSNSSQVAGTPGVSQNLTPAAQPSERQRPPVDAEKMHKVKNLNHLHGHFMKVGKRCKYDRDAVLKRGESTTNERQNAMAVGIQSVISYMYAMKLQSDAFDLEHKNRIPKCWQEILPLLRVVRNDCRDNDHLTAMLMRVHAMLLSFIGRSYWSVPIEPGLAETVIAATKQEHDMWRLADVERRKLGVYNGNQDSSDGGPIGKLIDRLGPGTPIEDLVQIVLEVIRKAIRLDGTPWKPVPELRQLGRYGSNGIPDPPDL